jgi:hypothetical protein
MKMTVLAVLIVNCLAHTVFAQDRQQVSTTVEAVALANAVTYQTALARADVAVAKSVLNENLLKGEVGEAIRDQVVGRFLHDSGQWLNVSPQMGPQGLDHVSMQLDENGVPRRLMVDETKFGSSRLSVTRAGDVQMGQKWVSDRLRGLADRYEKIAAAARLGGQRAKVPQTLSARQTVPVPLSETESVTFWRSEGTWYFDGPAETLPRAVSQLGKMSGLVRAAAEGRIDYPKRIFQVKPEGDLLRLSILDASAVEASHGNLGALPVKARIDLPLVRSSWTANTTVAAIADDLRRQLPHLDPDDARRLAQGCLSSAETAEAALSQQPFGRFATTEGVKVGGTGMVLGVALETAFQLFGNGRVDWNHVAATGGLAGGSAAAGSLFGNATTFALVDTELGYTASAKAAQLLGLKSASQLTNFAGSAVGGGMATALFAYGGYWLGYYDLKTANRSFMAGTAGTLTGAAAGVATLSLVAAYGTAGTGAAISTLGGAAATDASLALLGGGTLASGGFGVAGGTVLVSTGVGVVIVGVTAAVLYGFHAHEEAQDNIRLAKTISYLTQKKTFFISDQR